MIDPFAGMDLPLPPELAQPYDSADAMVERVAAEAVALAEDVGISPAEAATQLADPVEGAGRWTVDGDGSAEWAMRHVVRAQAELDALARQAGAWQDRIAQWFDHRAKPLQATVAFMEAHLERYALAVRASDRKRRTLVLPSGAVKTTQQGPKVVVRNEHQALAWAEAHQPGAIARDPRLRVGELRKAVRPVELLTEADLTFSCGHTYRRDDPNGLQLPDVGTEMECSEHGPALLGSVTVRATRWVPLASDGTMPLGLDVDPGGITAKVVPAP